MRLISGNLKSTQLPQFSVLANIAPPKLRHEAAAVREFLNCIKHAQSLLLDKLQNLSDQR
jgi:hypothetical protein